LFSGLSFDPDFDDSATCWHGKNYEDCNKEFVRMPGGCKWWHFYPTETFEEHVKKFHQLTNNVYKSKLELMFEDSE
jgi:hypothetical protein